MRFLLYLLLWVPVAAWAGEEADFQAARDAYRAGNAARLEQYADKLQDTLFEPYVAYYRLNINLAAADPKAVERYLARPADTPLVERLRIDWLRLLGKNGLWSGFEQEYPKLAAPDEELRCYNWQARWQHGDEGALRESRELWMVGKSQPNSCQDVFDVALARGILTPQDVRRRMQLAMEAGNLALFQKLAADLGLNAAGAEQAQADPARYLDGIDWAAEGESGRLVAKFAVLRLAKKSSDQTESLLQRLAPQLSEEERRYFYGWLGYEAARRGESRALGWYLAAGGAALSPQQAEWRVRAALRVKNWNEVLNGINRLEPAQQRESAWRYWRARALKAQGKTLEANKLLAEQAAEYNFYGQLANDELGSVATAGIDTPAFKPGKAELKAMQARPAIKRALAFYRMDMRTEGVREWNWAMRGMDDKQLLTAAEVARQNEIYDRSISSADRVTALRDFSLSFPAPYRADLEPHLRDNGLEEAWVYGLMRQESRFVTQAKSGVGAAGLMQVMPSTARWIAKKLGLKSYKNSLIHQMETNLKLGTYYMKTVLSWFDGSEVMACAAYNAGPGRARRWRGDIPLEGAIYAETIPFDETRDYVKKVMSNTVYYAALFGQPGPSLKERLGVIEAKSAANQAPIPDEK